MAENKIVAAITADIKKVESVIVNEIKDLAGQTKGVGITEVADTEVKAVLVKPATDIAAQSLEDGVPVLKVVHYADTPYTTAIILGQGVYVHVLGPKDTFTTRSTVPFTTEPAVKINDDGFNTTNTQYIRVTK